MTNADKIRTMTIYELAVYLTNVESCPMAFCPKEDDYFYSCIDCWENWLKSECEKEV